MNNMEGFEARFKKLLAPNDRLQVVRGRRVTHGYPRSSLGVHCVKTGSQELTRAKEGSASTRGLRPKSGKDLIQRGKPRMCGKTPPISGSTSLNPEPIEDVLHHR
jgi:hypothetical protein